MTDFQLYEMYDYLTGHFFAELTNGNESWIIHDTERDVLHQAIGYLLMHLQINI